MILQILILVLILGVCPLACGLVPTFFVARQKITIPMIYISGLILCLAIFQLVAVPIVIANGNGFNVIVVAYSIVLGLVSVAGCVLAFFKQKKEGGFFAKLELHRNVTIEEAVEWIMFAVVLGFQIFMFTRMAAFDGDDAYYITNSLLTYETGTLYRILPYTGLGTMLDIRHSLAVFPMWISYVSKVSGIHPTIFAHNILGIVMIPVTYMIYSEIGRNILKREPKKLPIFMIFVGIMQIFGNVSIYTNATFFLMRTWQGKSLLANVCIPGVLMLMLFIFESDSFEGDRRFGFWFDLFVLNIVAAMCSTASVFLMAMLIGITGLVLAIKEKDIQIILRLVITCFPLVAYGVAFLLL